MTVLTTCAFVTAVVAGVRGTWSPCGLSMVSSINPFSEAGRGHRYALTCAWFVLGAVLGGLVLGTGTAVLAAAGSALPGTALLAGAAALVTFAADLRLLTLPTHPRQVDERWLSTFRPWVYGVGFGLQIGLGFATYVMTAATYLLVVLAALTGSPVIAVLVGGTFGLTRGLAVLLGAWAGTPAQLRDLHRRLDELAPTSLRAAIAVQALLAVALGASAGPAPGLLATGVVLAALGGRRLRHVVVREVPFEPASELLGG